MNKKRIVLPTHFTKNIIIPLIIMFTMFAYWNIKEHQFLNFDDNVYVTDNVYVKYGLSIKSIIWAFSFHDIAYWHPLTWLSHMLDCQLFGLTPAPHFFVNLFLHICNALLLFLILFRVTKAEIKAAFVALLFALYPLNVESVTWLAERKTVLSTLFFLSAIYTYIFYVEKKTLWKYLLMLGLYIFGLMSKPYILTLPVLLLLLDYWPLKRFQVFDNDQGNDKKNIFRFINRLTLLYQRNRIIILEKIPLIFLSLLSSIVTIASLWAYRTIIDEKIISIVLRVYNFFFSIILYLRNIIWPVELSIYYPFPKKVIISYFLVSLLVVILITVLVIMVRKKRPWLLIGWLWFLIALMPASGLIQAGLWPAIANRFMYIPMIGIFMMIVWEADARLKGKYSQLLKAILCTVLLIYFAFLTRVQVIYYSNSFAVFKRSLEVAGPNEVAYNSLGNSFLVMGRIEEAMDYYAKSIEFNPRYYSPYYNYGVCLLRKNEYKKANIYFQKALSLNRWHAESYINISFINKIGGKKEEALEAIKKALEIDRNNLIAYNAYADLLAQEGKREEAIDKYLFILKRNPGDISARSNLAKIYEKIGRYEQANSEYVILAKNKSVNSGYAYYQIAGIYSQQKKYKECKEQLELSHKEGFNVLDQVSTDNRFKNFRSTIYYTKFLKTHKKDKLTHAP